MAYVHDLLTDGEHIVLRSRQHWMALVIRARNAFLLWLIGLLIIGAILWFRELQGEAARNILSVASGILVVIGLAIFAYRAWQFFSQDYVVTNRRLLKVTGILTKHSADSSLEKINDALLSQTIIGRMMGYGDLEILTASDVSVDRYHMLKNPIAFKKTILTEKHSLEMSYAYGSQPPTPPMRASTPPPPMVPVAPPTTDATPATEATPASEPTPAAESTAPPEVPPAPEAPAVAAAPEPAPAAAAPDSEQITETLSRLADLRDEGAITAEEYEQKKDELLGRL